MKEFKIENITIEMSNVEALKIREALEWYLDTRLDSYNLYGPEDEESCKKCFGMTPEERNAIWRKEERERIESMMKVLWNAYMGYPFYD